MQIEIPDPGILSASTPFSASDGETFAVWETAKGIQPKVKAREGRASGRERVNVAEGRMRCSQAAAERTRMRRRNQSWLLFHRDTDEARRLTGRIPELRQQVEAEMKERAGWPVEEQKSRPKSLERLAYRSPRP